MRMLLLLCFCLAEASLIAAEAVNEGKSVVVLYNSEMPESRQIAEYYAEKRKVPANQVYGFSLPTGEIISRREYEKGIAEPLLKKLKEQNLWTFKPDTRTNSAGKKVKVSVVASASVRYAVLCYGVPVKISPEGSIKEDGLDKLRPELRRNEAAVDNELAALPLNGLDIPITGPLGNHVYGTTNLNQLHPTNGVLLVARLDGPSAELARGLVDKALAAEQTGLWGRAYFDARGFTNGNYKLGDDWIRIGADRARYLGMETVLDSKPETFTAAFPMSQIAIYAGWYDGDVSGPFTRPNVEFMPGAFAYHLHSFSAQSVRTATRHWVGPLIAKGATITMGSVEEPYLTGTPDVGAFLGRWFFLGMSFGEAAYACQTFLSWQTTVIGDPLYRPFAVKWQERDRILTEMNSPLLEWSELRIANFNMVQKAPMDQVLNFVLTAKGFTNSAVLHEKAGDILNDQGKIAECIDFYLQALQLKPTPQQSIRLMIKAGLLLPAAGRGREALEIYRAFIKQFSDYPDLKTIYSRALPLAEQYSPDQVAEFKKGME
ncbi:MAG: TIGR03790 family protein [Verrucomicrobiota bacterium]|nr:TIGR03790 family protein [Verrucomicrobiota bacterium]